jgi:hypothetical protein
MVGFPLRMGHSAVLGNKVLTNTNYSWPHYLQYTTR